MKSSFVKGIDAIFESIESLAAKSVGRRVAALYIHDKKRGDLYRSIDGQVRRVALHAGILQHVLRTGATVNITNVALDPRFSIHDVDHLGMDDKVEAIIAAPVMRIEASDDSNALGVIQIANKCDAGAIFTPEDEWRLTQVCAQATLALEFWETTRRSHHLAASIKSLEVTTAELEGELQAGAENSDRLHMRAEVFSALGHEEDLDRIFPYNVKSAHTVRCRLRCVVFDEKRRGRARVNRR